MSDESTGVDTGWLEPTAGSAPSERRWALTIAWSLFEPERLGETTLFDADGRERILGRGEPPDDETLERLVFWRHRPGGAHTPSPLAAAGISRDQLRVLPRADELVVRRTGRCALRVNGQPAQEAAVGPGDVLTLASQLVLLVSKRPLLLSRGEVPVQPFGAPDESGLVGETAVMWEVRERLAFIARAERHVLILGESGVGKELAARAIHRASKRSSKPLVARNAATFPAALIDAELFGNAAGYPNPGMAARPGVVGQADGSTLFLDEIGEMPEELQAHLLRVLDGGEYHRLGEAEARRADLRLVAGTNREADELKHDLRARLPLRITLPPLRRRAEDIPLLAEHLLKEAAAETPELLERFFESPGAEEARPRIAPELVERMLRHDYPLNVRELDTILWAALGSSPSHIIALTSEVEALLGEERAPADAVRSEPTVEEIQAALDSNHQNRTRAARALGLSRFALYRLLRKHGLR